MRRSLVPSLLALVAFALAAPAARAEEPATHWYGWQTLTSDAVAFGLAAGAIAESSSGSHNGPAIALGIAAGLVFVAVPPIIHGYGHHRRNAVLWSLALRTVIPLGAAGLGFVVGQAFNGRTCDDCGPGSAVVVGALFGGLAIVGAPLIDGFANSTETVAPRLTLAPVTDRGHLARGLGLALHF